jgi:hypothetical protein
MAEVEEHDHHHSHKHLHVSVPSLYVPDSTISPTSVSPRSANPSESSDENGSDLESLVVAALAEGEQQHNYHQEPESKISFAPSSSNMFDPMMMASQSMMPMMMPMMQQTQGMMPYGYQMPYVPMGDYGMMSFGMLAIQWRFQGQPLAPMTIHMTASVRDVVSLAFNRLLFDRVIQSTDRISLSVLVNNQRYGLDESAHAGMPLSMVGFSDPSAILDIVKVN